MITATLFQRSGAVTGFRVSGHSGYAQEGEDIVCSAVSSAVQLTVNNLQSFVPCAVCCREADATVELTVSDPEDERVAVLLAAFAAHMQNLSEQFSGYVNLNVTEG